MVKIISVVCLFACMCAQAQAQCFEKGNKIIETGLAFTYLKYQSYNPDFEEKDNSEAANFTFPISFEYAAGNRIGVGLQLDIVNYFTERDTIKNAIATAKSFDVAAKFNFHWLKKNKTDLYSGIAVGVSSFKYEDNSSDEAEFNATGGTFRFTIIGSRFYISDHIALGAFFNTVTYSYKNGEISNKFSDKFPFELTGNGSQLGFSINYKW
ncbi:MAG TPA: hypothetical protein PKN75_12945 [Bacteroidia bacterium]|nr:hypothetical protein [Bacteroidia bacterium]HNU34487.1 hypothetical protein [Bacteroidia bacterium]